VAIVGDSATLAYDTFLTGLLDYGQGVRRAGGAWECGAE
jgi:hypothetical protein